ncbi:NADH-quinone oxidoreductase subunit A [Flexibacter flexilis DSM 6793]|uniref:NADH-quinone oxidoreductase subunit A n=1 Tax=Flexibacter flexilis DSM 6793 TaxID=927664 RepID=A0A1I1K5U3_9BACT|nr:NADH-quinone oxidoreductase subunit A [Flexibacter flexilis]SFC53383.1 NADH-quinone oxidoreductase subunit A [Flexibacter flexilis DSM 6793]
MQTDFQISGFGLVLLFMLGAAAFLGINLLISKVLRPDAPNPEKNLPYECGEEAIGSVWGQFNIRFYVIALIFILFDVELAFMFPWATVFGNEQLQAASGGSWGWFALAEMGFFVLILAVGLAYAWQRGHLDWAKPKPQLPTAAEPLPEQIYERFLK